MNHSKNWLISILFILIDIVVLLAIFQAALVLRGVLIGPGASWAKIAPLVQLGILFCVGIFLVQGLYPGYGLTAVKELEHITKAISLAFFLLVAVAYLNKPYQDFSRSIIIGAWAITLITIPLVHFILRNILSRKSWYGQPVHIYGDKALAEKLVESLSRVRRLGWQVKGVMPLGKIPLLDQDQTWTDIAILTLSSNHKVASYVRDLNQYYRKIILVRDIDNFGSLYVEPRDLEGRLGLEFQYHLLVRRSKWLKAAMDGVGVILLSVLLMPVMAILAVLVYIDSPGPVFYFQERIGINFKRFQVLKFRTMEVDADKKLAVHLQGNPKAKEEFEKFHKLEHDPRVTRVGKWLRRYSLDELPQLWHVLKGEMSLVGPRAYMPEELSAMGSYAATILRVKPGMTGWWQVLGRHNTTFKRRLQMDEYYISNWSLWMDIYVLLKTVGVVVSGQGV